MRAEARRYTIRYMTTTTVYGIRSDELKEVFLFGVALGLLSLGLFLAIDARQGTLHRPGVLTFAVCVATAIGFAIPAVVALAALLSVAVDGTTIKQILLGRWVVQTRELKDLKHLAIAQGIAAVTMEFHDGSVLRLYGVHRTVRGELIADLEARVPTVTVTYALQAITLRPSPAAAPSTALHGTASLPAHSHPPPQC